MNDRSELLRGLPVRDLPIRDRLRIFRSEVNKTILNAKKSGLLTEEENAIRGFFGSVSSYELRTMLQQKALRI